MKQIIIFLQILLLSLIMNCNKENKFSYKRILSGVEYQTNGLIKRIIFYNSSSVRVSVIPINISFTDTSLVVIAKPADIEFDISDGKELELISSNLKVCIDKSTGAIKYLNPKNTQILAEHPSYSTELKQVELLSENYFSVKQSFKLSEDEGIYGLGQFQNGFMNYRNKDLLLVQANKIAIVPFLVSTANYGILWDNYSKTKFHDDKNETSFSSAYADQLDYYFVAGENMDEVISGYRFLTGQAPMFAKKAYGFWQSKERYTSFDELHEVVDTYRSNGIPIDNIIQDWRYWGDNDKWSSMYFEPENFNNPAKNIQKLHDKNVNVMVSIWPVIGEKTRIYKEMNEKGFLLNQNHWCGGKVYDAYSSEARDIYWKHIKLGLAANNIDGYWMDGTEPEFFSTGSQEVTETELLKVGKTSIGPIAKYLNTYSLATTEGVYKSHREMTDKKRVFILTRSAFAGQQRNASVTWSGDIEASFPILKKQISAGINFSMAGIPYWTHDIGAFFTSGYSKGIENPAYQELFVRWFQFGAFTPIFRAHGTQTPREVYQLKDCNPDFYNALVKITQLRSRLIPYIYSNAWKVTNENYTLMRGMMMDFPEDKNTFDINDQFMFGSSFLVKPITKEMYYSIKKPPGVIPEENLKYDENQKGLKVTYFNGLDLQNVILKDFDEKIDNDWSGGGLPLGVPESKFSARWEGNIIPTETGEHTIAVVADDGVKVWLKNQLVINEWQDQGATLYEHKINLSENEKCPVKIEYYQNTGGAKISLNWETPSEKLKQKDVVKSKLEKVYLPEHTGWYDFWTNEFYEGNQTIEREFPIHIMPLYVKAGSIVPVGPIQQYVDEKPGAPIEIRIYPGANGKFVLYEDEGDNYNYEKGECSTIPFTWSENSKTLIVGARTGTFSGMLQERTFKIINVRSDVVKEIRYFGKSIEVRL